MAYKLRIFYRYHRTSLFCCNIKITINFIGFNIDMYIIYVCTFVCGFMTASTFLREEWVAVLVVRVINLYELSFILHKLHNNFVTISVFELFVVAIVAFAVCIYILLQRLAIFHRHCDDATQQTALAD